VLGRYATGLFAVIVDEPDNPRLESNSYLPGPQPYLAWRPIRAHKEEPALGVKAAHKSTFQT